MNIMHKLRAAGVLIALGSALAVGPIGLASVAAAAASNHGVEIMLASGQPPTAGTALRRPCKAGIWVSGCRNKPPQSGTDTDTPPNDSPPPISDAARDCYKACKSDGSSTAACQKSCL